ncbi:MAG: peptidoglycan-associated lipoprotein, partial [Deltaproteobacteria bacterium]|nr:peptidoglycan-associated lipoprotein [Deltaproteobacteria bacterium]
MRKLLLLAVMTLMLAPLAVGCSKKPDAGGETGGLTDADRAFLNQHVYFDFDRYNIRPDQVDTLLSKAAYLS